MRWDKIGGARMSRNRRKLLELCSAQIIIDIAEPFDQPAGNRAFGYLVGRGPARIVGIELQRKAVGLPAEGILHQTGKAFEIFFEHPWAVIELRVAHDQQVAAAKAQASARHAPDKAELAHLSLGERAQCVGGLESYGAGRAEIADIGEVRPFAKIEPLDSFGDQEIEVAIALSVLVRTHVDRHAIDKSGEIGPVIEIEAAQKDLVGLAAARVLRGDEAGDVLE